MQADDKVWFDAAHKDREICREIQISSAAGQRVLVLAHFALTLSAVEANLRQSSIEYQRFSSYDFAELCHGPPATAGGTDRTELPATAVDTDGKDSAAQGGQGRVWLGLARSFQASSSLAKRSHAAPPVKIIIAEHHPLQVRDQPIIESAAALSCESQIGFHLALDDPLLDHFGGASLRPLLERLGLAAGECISHPLVTSAIRHAQEKIERTVHGDVQTESMADWFKYNLPQKA